MRYLHHILICVMLLAAASGASAQTSNQAMRSRLQKEIEMLDRQLKEVREKSSDALSSLNLVRRKMTSRKKLLTESDRQISSLDGQIKEKNAEIVRCQAQLDTMTVQYEKLIRSAYKNRDSRIWYLYLLSSENLGQATRRYGYLKSMSTQMNAQARIINETREELERQKGDLEVLRAEAGKLREQRAADLGKLQKEEATSKNLVNQLNRDKSKYQKQLAAKRKQVEALNSEVKKMVARRSKNVDVKLDAEFSANRGKLPWPAEGVIVEGFGEHYHPVYKKVKLPFNNGVNIAVAKDAEVKAVFDGVVKQVIVMPGYNRCVLIQHGGYYTFYCKLATVSVKAGDKIKTGQSLGRVDTIAGETQLHFQIWEGSSPKDPELWLN